MAFLGILFAASVMFVVVPVRGEEIAVVTHAEWDGIILYAKVDRDVVQAKLDEFHQSRYHNQNEPRLELPATRPFPNVTDPGQHVIFFGIGHVKETDFDRFNDSAILSRWDEIGVTIPYLTGGSDLIPHYGLAIGALYQRTDRDLANPDFAFPRFPVDELSITEHRVVLRNGSDEMILDVTRHLDPCEPAVALVRHEFEDDISDMKHIGAREPQFGICDRHPYDTAFCRTVWRIGDDMEEILPNFCQTWWHSPHAQQCDASVAILNITPGFKKFFLLEEEDPIEFAVHQTNRGNFTIGLKYPCVV